MKAVNHQENVATIFSSLEAGTLKLSARESSGVEFKESFNWGSKDKYAKSLAAFANNHGGYLIFGVKNRPRCLVGLSNQNFEELDEAVITSYFNNLFSPEIRYEKFVETIQGRKVGLLYVHEHEEKPVIPIKNDGDVREAEIYYRYNARTEKIKYPELRLLFEETKEMERTNWMRLFERIASIGPENTGILNMAAGTIEGSSRSLLIDESLIPKLKFITEGQFAEKGRPVLKLVGDVRPVSLETGAANNAGMRITTDPAAMPVREETILKEYPLDYYRLVEALTGRYSDFKTNQKFYDLKREFMKEPRNSRSRYLDPSNPKSGKKDFYSRAIIPCFDPHYTKLDQGRV